MLKTKILRILAYWVTALILITVIQTSVKAISAQLATKNNQITEQVPPTPEVLGASTSIRGSFVPGPSPIVKIKNADTNTINAKSFLVFELATGQMLAEKNPAEKLGIASLTKLMTGFVAYQNAQLNASLLVSGKDTINTRPILGLVPGDEVTALDVFNAMLIGSSNDAALALANYVSRSTGQNFITLMNAQAKTLGMNNTHYSNALGFDSENNYSTADDLKILISATEKLAAFTNLGRRTSYEFSGALNKTYLALATNKLLKKYPEIEAIKTGYTENSGGAMATKISINGKQIVIIVLGSQDREGDTLKLKNEILKDFKWD